MLHACSYTICLVFCYTSWRFYAFSGTNLLTRCHSVSSLFSAVFVFQKSCAGNILGIGWNKSRTSYYLLKLPDDRRGDGEGPGASLTTRGRGPAPGRAALWWGRPGPLLTLPLWCGTMLMFFHRPVGNPKRKVWWAQQQVFPSVRNQGLSVQEKAKLQKVMLASLVTSNKGAVYNSY
jgi:hypothetical protein